MSVKSLFRPSPAFTSRHHGSSETEYAVPSSGKAEREREEGKGRERAAAGGERNTCVAVAVATVRLAVAERGAPVSPGFLSVANRRSECEHNRRRRVGGCRIKKDRHADNSGRSECRRLGGRNIHLGDLGMTSGECLDLRATRENNGAR